MKRIGSGRYGWNSGCPILVLLCLGFIGCITGPVFAFEKTDTLTDREIVERLTRLEESIKSLTEAVNRGFQSTDQRFQGVEQRFQGVEQRFQGMEQSFNQRFDQIIQLLIGIVATFGGIVAVAIGFALWDRRTMIRPFETKTRMIEEELAQNKDKLHRLIEALRELAKQDGKIAEVLRSFALL